MVKMMNVCSLMAFDGHGSVSTSNGAEVENLADHWAWSTAGHNPIIISHLTNNKTVGWGGGGGTSITGVSSHSEICMKKYVKYVLNLSESSAYSSRHRCDVFFFWCFFQLVFDILLWRGGFFHGLSIMFGALFTFSFCMVGCLDVVAWRYEET